MVGMSMSADGTCNRMAIAWQSHGNRMAVAWQSHGGRMAIAWQTHGWHAHQRRRHLDPPARLRAWLLSARGRRVLHRLEGANDAPLD
eukprot:7382484-Prymnesium_polylepis.1